MLFYVFISSRTHKPRKMWDICLSETIFPIGNAQHQHGQDGENWILSTGLSENSLRLATGFHFWEKTNYQQLNLKMQNGLKKLYPGRTAKGTIAACRESPEERCSERRPLCCLQKVPLPKSFKGFQKSTVSVMWLSPLTYEWSHPTQSMSELLYFGGRAPLQKRWRSSLWCMCALRAASCPLNLLSGVVCWHLRIWVDPVPA